MARVTKKQKELTIEEKLAEALVPESEQPYPVPENWQYYRIRGLVSRLKRGKAPKYVAHSEIPVFAQKCNQKDGTIAMEKAQFLNPELSLRIDDEGFLRDKDILINSTGTGTLGRVGYFRSKCALPYIKVLPDSHITVVRAADIVNSHYLYLFFKFKQSYLELQGVGTTNQKELKPDSIGNIVLPLPPLAEQQRIVTRIESLFSKLDEAKEKAQAVVDGFEDRKAAILHKAFTGELTEGWRKRKNVSRESWLTQSLKDSCCIGSGGTPSRKNPEYYLGMIPWIKTGEINWNEIYDSEEHISQSAIDNSSAKLYPVGAVLVAMYGMGVTRGRAAILKVEATTNQAVCVLQPKDYLLNRFLYYYFMCNYWDVRERAVGGNQLNLSGTIIAKFNISIPTIAEQQEIILLLDSLLEKEKQAKEAAEQVISQIDTMKKSILARAFRGDLGTNDPADKSAIELLKRVL